MFWNEYTDDYLLSIHRTSGNLATLKWILKNNWILILKRWQKKILTNQYFLIISILLIISHLFLLWLSWIIILGEKMYSYKGSLPKNMSAKGSRKKNIFLMAVPLRPYPPSSLMAVGFFKKGKKFSYFLNGNPLHPPPLA